MSIYASIFAIENTDEWIKDMNEAGIEAGVISDGPLPDEAYDAPIIYQGSHVLPSEDSKRGGSLDLALIPGHIEREGREDEKPEDELTPYPYLRIGIDSKNSDTRYSPPIIWRKQGSYGKPWYRSWNFLKTLNGAFQWFLRKGVDYPYIRAGQATVVLTKPQVERLRDSLSSWLEEEK